MSLLINLFMCQLKQIPVDISSNAVNLPLEYLKLVEEGS